MPAGNYDVALAARVGDNRFARCISGVVVCVVLAHNIRVPILCRLGWACGGVCVMYAFNTIMLCSRCPSGRTALLVGHDAHKALLSASISAPL